MRKKGSDSIKHILVAPTLLFFVGITIFLLLFNVIMSFSNMQLGGAIKFVGLDNYISTSTNKIFWKTIYNTIRIVIISVGAEYVLGMILAYNISKLMHGKKIIRVLMLLPMLMAPVVIAFMWKQIFNESYGPLNYFLNLLGLGGIKWISMSGYSIFSIILVDIWEWTPFVTLILLAGFQSLPKEPLESARVDGASEWHIFWDHIFKMLLPASGIAITLRAIETFKIFDTVYIITAGGPGVSSMSASMYTYQIGLRNFNLGKAAAMCIIMLIIVMFVFNLITKFLVKRKQRLAQSHVALDNIDFTLYDEEEEEEAL